MATVKEYMTTTLCAQCSKPRVLLADDVAVGGECVNCGVAFDEGDSAMSVLIGPQNATEAARATTGGPYNACWVLAHTTCTRN